MFTRNDRLSVDGSALLPDNVKERFFAGGSLNEDSTSTIRSGSSETEGWAPVRRARLPLVEERPGEERRAGGAGAWNAAGLLLLWLLLRDWSAHCSSVVAALRICNTFKNS